MPFVSNITKVIGEIKGIGPEGWRAIAQVAGKRAAIGAAIGGAAGLGAGALDKTPGNTLSSGIKGAALGAAIGGGYGAWSGGVGNAIKSGWKAGGGFARQAAETVSEGIGTVAATSMTENGVNIRPWDISSLPHTPFQRGGVGDNPVMRRLMARTRETSAVNPFVRDANIISEGRPLTDASRAKARASVIRSQGLGASPELGDEMMRARRAALILTRNI